MVWFSGSGVICQMAALSSEFVSLLLLDFIDAEICFWFVSFPSSWFPLCSASSCSSVSKPPPTFSKIRCTDESELREEADLCSEESHLSVFSGKVTRNPWIFQQKCQHWRWSIAGFRFELGVCVSAVSVFTHFSLLHAVPAPPAN